MKDRRCSFSRFLSVVAKPMDRLGEWAQDRLCRTFVALECDFLRGKRFASAVTVKAPATADGTNDSLGENGGHTSSKVLDIVDRSIRDSCANVVSVSVMMLSKPENLRICGILLSPARPLKVWEGGQNKRNRSSHECEQWAVEQASGAYMQHLNDMVAGLSNRSTLTRCGFAVDPHQRPTWRP